MTKAAALHQFFSAFGMPAYTADSVPAGAAFPYLTYELVTSAWEGGEVSLAVQLWYKTQDGAAPNAKAEEVSAAIGYGGKMVRCDEGLIWLKRGSPWCQSARDESDSEIKRRCLNVIAEYLTRN